MQIDTVLFAMTAYREGFAFGAEMVNNRVHRANPYITGTESYHTFRKGMLDGKNLADLVATGK